MIMQQSKVTLWKLALLATVVHGYSIGTYNRYMMPADVVPPNEEERRHMTNNNKNTNHEADGKPELNSSLLPRDNTAQPRHLAPDSTVIGERYVLASDEAKQSSGKSFIFEAFPQDHQGQPLVEEPVVVKLSANTDALEREAQNYLTIAGEENSPEGDGLFVKVHDYVEQEADPSCPEDLENLAALVMEKGGNDLQNYILRNGRLRGKELQEVAKSAIKCVGAVHENNMVWTDIKTSNFVTTISSDEFAAEFGTPMRPPGSEDDDSSIKGIDLESAVSHSDPPFDYTVYASPPEFALEFLCGREAQMPMDYSFDVWSLGMLLYEIATGTPYFHPDDDIIDIAMTLKNTQGQLDLNKNGDEHILDEDLAMRDLIERCLEMDPASRPSVNQLLSHPYFLQTR